MAGNPTTFKQKPRIKNGNTAQTDLKLADYMPVQHEDINSGVMTINHISVAQSLCQPVATTPNSTPSGGAYTATCSNYPDFSLTYLDKDGNSHYLIGMKVRVIFTTGITYGSVSGGTYPTLNINGSGAIPLLAQGKTMASGACSAGQSLEFTLIPYGNGVAWDADSNVRESTSDYTIYTDGSTTYKSNYINNFNQVSHYIYSDDMHEEFNGYKTLANITLPKGIYSIQLNAMLDNASPNIRHTLTISNKSVGREIVFAELPASSSYTSGCCNCVFVLQNPTRIEMQIYSAELSHLFKYSYVITSLRTDF